MEPQPPSPKPNYVGWRWLGWTTAWPECTNRCVQSGLPQGAFILKSLSNLKGDSISIQNPLNIDKRAQRHNYFHLFKEVFQQNS